MGTMNKKLYIKQTNGTAVGCNIYTTAAEAGDKSLTVRADGVAGYVALKPITDSNATAGRVSIGGVTYAIAMKHESGGGAGKGSLTGNGKDGGDTSAFGITATGGYGAGVAWSRGDGGTPNGITSSGNSITDGFLMSFDLTKGTYGRGGNYGGSGGYDSQYVSVTAGQSYTITVGGAGGTGGTGGFVLIGYGGDI